MSRLKEFTKNDWYGLAGAEKFEDGSEPLLFEDTDIIAVVDANGLYFDLTNYETEELTNKYGSVTIKDKKMATLLMETVLEKIHTMTRDEAMEYLNYVFELKLGK